MHYEYFPEEFIQLQLEIGKHPRLVQRLQRHATQGVEVIFAETAHYCGYGINDLFDGEQLAALADVLTTKLKAMPVKEAIKELSTDWSKEEWKYRTYPH